VTGLPDPDPRTGLPVLVRDGHHRPFPARVLRVRPEGTLDVWGAPGRKAPGVRTVPAAMLTPVEEPTA
jgi:hypothetical protein